MRYYAISVSSRRRAKQESNHFGFKCWFLLRLGRRWFGLDFIRTARPGDSRATVACSSQADGRKRRRDGGARERCRTSASRAARATWPKTGPERVANFGVRKRPKRERHNGAAAHGMQAVQQAYR
jgi:hypothetical protein